MSESVCASGLSSESVDLAVALFVFCLADIFVYESLDERRFAYYYSTLLLSVVCPAEVRFPLPSVIIFVFMTEDYEELVNI